MTLLCETVSVESDVAAMIPIARYSPISDLVIVACPTWGPPGRRKGKPTRIAAKVHPLRLEVSRLRVESS
ncbi:MAG: hypothetical protein WAU25_03645 [Nitrososphaeraceae archaeon]